MADFQIALKHVMAQQGTNAHVLDEKETEGDILLCSDCFRDQGLKLNAISIGTKDNQKCPNCKSTDGHKLTKNLVRKLCYIFFVKGTIQKFEYGGSPLIQFNEDHFNESEIKVSPWLENDVKLIEKAGEIGLFYYGPRFWMLGEVEPLKSLKSEAEQDQIIQKVLQTYPVRILTSEHSFYRLRCNPKVSSNILEYDSPPDIFLGNNRFDNACFPILYGSPDLELCLNECRTTVEDNLYVGKLVPAKSLKVLDLSALIVEDGSEFESLDLAIHFLFLAGKHSYSICKQIAQKAKVQGFDGIIYPSFFSYVRTGAVPFDTVYGISIRKLAPFKDFAQSQSVPNLALFGRPIKEKKVIVDCINKVIINRISYDLSFGPTEDKTIEVEEHINERMTKYKNDIEKLFQEKK